MSKQNNPEGGIWNLVLIVTLLLGMRMVFFRSGVEIPEHLKAMIVEMMLAAAFLLVALKKEQQPSLEAISQMGRLNPTACRAPIGQHWATH